jgi:hypothetical protein
MKVRERLDRMLLFGYFKSAGNPNIVLTNFLLKKNKLTIINYT